MEGAGILLAATPQCLLVIDVTKLKINHYQSSKFEIPPLPAFEKLNLVGEGFPFGMCFFVRESKLFMVGVEKPIAEALPEKLRLRFTVDLDESFGERGFSRDIYVTDLTEPDSITNFQIEGKIYVLSGAPWHMDCLLPTPTFEVYDPLVGKWEALPEPPFYAAHSSSDCYDYHVYDYSVVGTPFMWWLPTMVARIIFLTVSMTKNGTWIPSDWSPICYQALKEVSEDYFLRDMVSESGVVLDLAQAPKRAETNTHGPLKLEQHKARDPKLAKTADASDVSQTSQHDNGNCHYRHPGYHMNYSGYLTKEFYVVDVQDGAVSVPSPFLSITCLSKSFYDLDAWALTHLTFAVPSSIDDAYRVTYGCHISFCRTKSTIALLFEHDKSYFHFRHSHALLGCCLITPSYRRGNISGPDCMLCLRKL
uniref:F-box/kelch-repeat protein n=1 Tax=Vitis vinifera TaxID=29760 RepID=A5BCT2_VITVI|nr:hypothetical protein VITISV_000708 [Vitis vinifera]